MEYSVGSLADLITGSNTPNKPKVVHKKLQKKGLQTIPKQTKDINKSKDKTKPLKKLQTKSNIEEIPQMNKIIKSEGLEDTKIEKRIKIKKTKRTLVEETPLSNKKIILEDVGGDTKTDVDTKLKKKKRKLDDTFPSDIKNEHSPSKKLKLHKKVHNAERRIKEKKKGTHRDTNEMERTLYVGNVPIQIDKKKVKQFFKKYGKIESIRIRGIPVADPKTSKKVAAIKKEFNSKRKNVFCYIKFANKDDALKAQCEDGALFEDHHLRVHICSSKEKPDESKAIFVGNLSFEAEEDELWKLFETCGPISNVRIIRDSQTGMGKGFAFVNFKDSDAVQLALEMENVKLGDRELRISLSNLKVAKKKKYLKNKKISQPGKPKQKSSEIKVEENKTTEDQGIKKPKAGFQGTKFTDKKKKRKVSKGLLQKKRMIKKLAPQMKTKD